MSTKIDTRTAGAQVEIARRKAIVDDGTCSLSFSKADGLLCMTENDGYVHAEYPSAITYRIIRNSHAFGSYELKCDCIDWCKCLYGREHVSTADMDRILYRLYCADRTMFVQGATIWFKLHLSVTGFTTSEPIEVVIRIIRVFNTEVGEPTFIRLWGERGMKNSELYSELHFSSSIVSFGFYRGTKKVHVG